MTVTKRFLLSIYIPQSESRAGCLRFGNNAWKAHTTPTLLISIQRNGSTCFSPCRQALAPPRRKPGGGRRRQLVFADPVVQISDGAMKEQIGHPRAETLSLVQKHILPFQGIH